MRITIIEDEKAHAELMERGIRKEFPDAQIDSFGCVEEFLKSLDQIEPDVIITDYFLPGGNGLDLLKKLQERDRDIPVVVVTGHGDEQIAVRAMKLGAYDYVAKRGDFFSMVPGIIRRVVGGKQLEKALHESQALYKQERGKLESVLASMVTPLVGLKSDMTIAFANPVFVRIFGKELIGKPCQGIFGNLKDASTQCLKAIKERQAKSLEFEDPNGRIWLVTISPSIESEGDGLKAVLVFQDITKSRQAEKVLREAHQELEVRVERRTAELARKTEQLKLELAERKRAEAGKERLQAQLQRAQKLEALGTLAGGIAHNFNNLLMGILGNASLMLLDTDPSHPHYKLLKRIEREVKSGARLTRQILGYARKGDYEFRPIDLNQLVEEMAETFGKMRKEITIDRKPGEDLLPIEADPAQIEQVLLNLYVNAADAMPGGGKITLKTANVTHEALKGKVNHPKPGRYVCLAVTDTGIGMDKETMKRIFDPFFTTKEVGQGTGLGLASVYGIINRHGGYIDIESKKGHGTTFNLYFPASEKEVQDTLATTTHDVTRGTGTVLLVDDEEAFLTAGRRWLEAIGYTVLTARDGKEAVQVYKQNRDAIDIVLLDIIMPNMGGGEAYDRLKEINPDVKVLVLSGYSIDGEATEMLKRGCNGFMQKPFRVEELARRIREILEKG